MHRCLFAVACAAALGSGCESGGAPDFSLKTLDGKEVSLGSLRGKPVLLNFWAVG